MTRVEVVNHNVGGGTTYGEALWSDGMARVGSVMRVVQDFNSHAVTMQECTESQFEFWRNHNGWYGVFSPMVDAHEDWTGERKGLAVLSRYPLLDSSIVSLGVGGLVSTGKDFNLLCASFDHPAFSGSDKLWVCTTHLWSAGHDHDGNLYSGEVNDAVRLHQAKQINEYLNPRVGWSRKYVLTGDFNKTPKSKVIDEIHRVRQDGALNVNGKFWEADQSHGLTGDNLARAGRDTITGRKIDYWFASHIGASPHESGIDMTLHGCGPNGGVPHDEVMRGWVNWTDVN